MDATRCSFVSATPSSGLQAWRFVGEWLGGRAVAEPFAWTGRPCAATRRRGLVLELAEKNNGEVTSSEVMDLLD